MTLATVAAAAVAAARARPSQLVAALPSVDGEDGKSLKKFGSIAAEVSPELGCAGQRERADRQGEVPPGRSVWVCRSCCRSDLVEGSVSRIGLLCLGSGAGIGALGFRKPIILVRGVSALLCVWLSSRYLRPVLKVPGAGAFRGFDSSAGLRLRLLLLLARDVQSAVPSLRSSVVLHAHRRRS